MTKEELDRAQEALRELDHRKKILKQIQSGWDGILVQRFAKMIDQQSLGRVQDALMEWAQERVEDAQRHFESL
jgi:hypothetical protein